METSLYSPVKRFLEGLGFEVKGEVCGCDLVALDRGTPAALVICELKLSALQTCRSFFQHVAFG